MSVVPITRAAAAKLVITILGNNMTIVPFRLTRVAPSFFNIACALCERIELDQFLGCCPAHQLHRQLSRHELGLPTSARLFARAKGEALASEGGIAV